MKELQERKTSFENLLDWSCVHRDFYLMARCCVKLKEIYREEQVLVFSNYMRGLLQNPMY